MYNLRIEVKKDQWKGDHTEALMKIRHRHKESWKKSRQERNKDVSMGAKMRARKRSLNRVIKQIR